MQPTLCVNRLRRCFGHFIISFHDIKPSCDKFTVCANRQFFARFGIDNLTFHAGECAAHRFHTVIQIFVYLAHRTAGRSFRLTVHADNFTHIHFRRRSAHQVRRTVRPCHDTRSHIREVGLFEILMAEHGNKHGRHAVKTSDFLAVDTSQRGLGREIRHRTNRTAVRHQVRHGKHHTETMEHRHLDHHSVRRGNIHSIPYNLTVVDDVRVRQHNALGKARRSRRILHITNVIGFYLRRSSKHLFFRHERAALQHFFPVQTAFHLKADRYDIAQERQFLTVQRLARLGVFEFGTKLFHNRFVIAVLATVYHDQRMRIRLTEQIFRFMDFISGVYRYEHGADFYGSPERQEPLRNVRCPNRHVMSGFYAHGNEGACHFVHVVSELRIRSGVFQSRVLESVLIGVSFYHLVQHLRKGQIDRFILLPRERTRLIAVIINFAVRLIFLSHFLHVIDKVREHDIVRRNIVVPFR